MRVSADWEIRSKANLHHGDAEARRTSEKDGGCAGLSFMIIYLTSSANESGSAVTI
jgi:hypothetical protein